MISVVNVFVQDSCDKIAVHEITIDELWFTTEFTLTRRINSLCYCHWYTKLLD